MTVFFLFKNPDCQTAQIITLGDNHHIINQLPIYKEKIIQLEKNH